MVGEKVVEDGSDPGGDSGLADGISRAKVTVDFVQIIADILKAGWDDHISHALHNLLIVRPGHDPIVVHPQSRPAGIRSVGMRLVTIDEHQTAFGGLCGFAFKGELTAAGGNQHDQKAVIAGAVEMIAGKIFKVSHISWIKEKLLCGQAGSIDVIIRIWSYIGFMRTHKSDLPYDVVLSYKIWKRIARYSEQYFENPQQDTRLIADDR